MPASLRSRAPLAGATLLLAILSGCGSDQPTTPPPGGGTPASVVIHAGNGQSAATGTAVAINPSVRVLDAGGAALSGIAVAFRVDSGGGSVSAPSAPTNASGVASPGAWTLGATGPQVLVATAGNLQPLKIRATLQSAGTTLATQTVSSGGGTLTVTKPGSPLNGLVLTLPNGAVSGSSTISLTEVSTAGVSLPAGVTSVSPALGISATSTPLQTPAIIRFPRSPSSSGNPAIALRNPATGMVTILPPVAMDATTITVALGALGGQAVPGLHGTTSLFGALRDDPGVLLFQVAVDPALIARDFDSGFRPGIDDWDFARRAVASLPFLRGGGQSQSTVDPADGMVATSIWYYVNRRTGSGALSGKFQLQNGEPESNRDGIRWSAIATSDVPDLFGTGGIAAAWDQQISLDAAGFATAQFTGIKTMFLLGFERPVPVLLFTGDEDTAPRIGVAYRTIGNSVDIAVPDNPGTSYRATFTAAGMTPFPVVGVNQLTYVVRAIAGLHYAMVVKDGTLSSQYGRVAAGTIGDSEGWPTVTLNFEDGALDTAAVFLADPLRHWWQCARCPDHGYRPTSVPSSASHVQIFRYGKIEGGSFAGLGSMFGSIVLDSDDIPGSATTAKSGNAIYMPGPGSSGSAAAAPGWLAWNTVTYKKMTLHPTPQLVQVGSDTTVTFVVAPTPAPPTGTKYAWVLRTDAGRDSVETALPMHTRNIESGTDGMLLIMALEPGTDRVIGRDSVEVTGGAAAPFWRLTSISDMDEYLPSDPSDDAEDDAALRRLLTSPGMGLIAVTETSATQSALELRILTTLWDPTAPSPTPARRPGEFHFPLGEKPTASFSFGPFFSGWGTNFWSQSSTDLNTGTMTAQSNFGTGVYQIKDGGSQLGPTGASRFTASRAGSTMNGTMFIWLWYIEESGEAENPPVGYRFPFTATRMR